MIKNPPDTIISHGCPCCNGGQPAVTAAAIRAMLKELNPTYTLWNLRTLNDALAAVLKERRLIEYTRGSIHILDVAGLERQSCECYRIIKNHLDNYAEFDSGIVV